METALARRKDGKDQSVDSLLVNRAERPSSTFVVKDGSADTSLSAATLRQIIRGVAH